MVTSLLHGSQVFGTWSPWSPTARSSWARRTTCSCLAGLSGPCQGATSVSTWSSLALGYLDVRVADTDYDTFAVLYIYKELEGALSTMVQLYRDLPSPHHCEPRSSQGPCCASGRTQEASPQATKAFQDFYPTVGLPDDMMVMLPKSDVCSSAGKEAS
ncbi:lipocalin-15 isoform X7 [Canis lupus dingo]|uniref:lipocalin-15 isoform X7 n=1 Tax=Canis lupus dingo TaxID=286419 RepID=UPI0020C3F9F6|nr:lipocalin-15 isoform X7 [Canis lupus dingo]